MAWSYWQVVRKASSIACVCAKGGHFEYSLWTDSVDFVHVCYMHCDILNRPFLRLTSWKPLWLDLQPADIKNRWSHNRKSAQVVNFHIVCNPTIQQPGFDLPRQQCTLLNHFRTEQGHWLRCLQKEMATYRHRRKLPPNSGGGSWPLPSPSLPSPPLTSLPSLPLSLKVGPPNPARGSGGAL